MDRIKNIDIFGEPISVKYRGEDAYNTFGGAIFTILIYVIVLVFAAVQA